MKFGFRVPLFKKRVSARTSWKRTIRHKMGLKMPRGMGMITNPKKAIYNKIYKKTTFGVEDLFKKTHAKIKKIRKEKNISMNDYYQELIETKGIKRGLSSARRVLCKKCDGDLWAVVERNILFKKYNIMYCEVCGSQQGMTYDKFNEITKS